MEVALHADALCRCAIHGASATVLQLADSREERTLLAWAEQGAGKQCLDVSQPSHQDRGKQQEHDANDESAGRQPHVVDDQHAKATPPWGRNELYAGSVINASASDHMVNAKVKSTMPTGSRRMQ
jgi:hypothetical protein